MFAIVSVDTGARTAITRVITTRSIVLSGFPRSPSYHGIRSSSRLAARQPPYSRRQLAVVGRGERFGTNQRLMWDLKRRLAEVARLGKPDLLSLTWT